MQSKSESANQLESRDQHSLPPYAVHSEPWWRTIGYSTVSRALAGGNASNLSSSEGPNGSLSNDDQSMSNGRLNEEDDDASKESQATASSRSVLNGGQENRNLQHVAPSMTAMRDEGLTQPTQLELVGHSIACASNPYQDPYYGGMMAPYGHQPLGYPFLGGHQVRMALPNEIAQEPVYVNAKQYPGILRRRQARAKAEHEKKLIKVRKPYLHESRHQHAMRRARGSGGRFAKKTGGDDSKNNKEGTANDTGAIPSSQSGSSSGSEQLPSDSAQTWNLPHGDQELRSARVYDTSEARNHINGGSHYQNHSGLQTLKHHPHSGEKGEDEDCSGQQRGSISSNQVSQRPLAIQ
ncbi:nuclear transcription factor Y subunit A-1 [Ricinus communis]|uniref:Nuclear transcription factor Y subunit n=1 Tax=Ricinus communis TaxID=3988 RepID=B9RID0_RICCO|nr:nuclear transcription factor Y subunit A-1 [Ricinus communis]XP_015571337.1 nuclear transcription factor Y subunit A-1 [Ricinus communis]XP_015571338.1 nuclear transcription factor Y subunit A-1 [Ricinus communis]EEF48902.1 Nuclear transcription factor Y subunit A-1, putative [Ricinus communis]|eukprot:XP_015571336.1 nuclear transcription factor Y subunit A-1 [Ricinus communis]